MIFHTQAVITDIKCFEVDFQKKKTQTVPARAFHGLTFRRSGKITVEWDGQRLISGPECVTFIPQGISYDTEILEDGSMCVVHFVTLDSYDGLQPMVLQPSDPRVLHNLFEVLKDRYQPGRERDYSSLSLAYQILSQVERELREHSGRVIPTRMRSAKKFIDQNFELPLSLEQLAGQAGVSETYFRREFKACFGLSPVAYIKKVRIENAKTYLTAGYYSVSEVAARCGFDNISYFSSEFHRVTGLTPKQYQKGMI